MTEVVMPIPPECVGFAEIADQEARAGVGTEAWNTALRKAAHTALCVWADHPNRRFYAPSTMNYATLDREFTRATTRVKVRYIMEPMMDAIMAEQNQIKRDRERHQRIVELAKQVSADPDSVFRRIPTEGG